MATKTEMITFILDNSEEYTQSYLDSLSYKKIKMVFENTEKLDENVNYPDLIDGDEINNDTDTDSDTSQKNIEKEVIEEEVEEVWSYENLSPNDKRLYRRTGIRRISKSKKYNRFNNEEPNI